MKTLGIEIIAVYRNHIVAVHIRLRASAVSFNLSSDKSSVVLKLQSFSTSQMLIFSHSDCLPNRSLQPFKQFGGLLRLQLPLFILPAVSCGDGDLPIMTQIQYNPPFL